MKILVTGARGFIGGHVVDALVADGHEVLGIDVKGPQEQDNPKAEYVQRNVAHLRHLGEPLDTEAVIHLAAFGGVARAAREPRVIFESNVLATTNLVEQIQRHMPKCKRVVHASSFSVYGNQYPVTERSPMLPMEAYAASKLAQELAFCGSGLPVTVLRFSSVYGRRMRLHDPEATILAKLAGWISQVNEVQLHEDGEQTRDFVHMRDVVAAIRSCLAVDVADCPGPINVCSGSSTSLNEACELLAFAMRKPLTVRYTGITRPGDMRDCGGNPMGLYGLIGRMPTLFDDGVREAFGV